MKGKSAVAAVQADSDKDTESAAKRQKVAKSKKWALARWICILWSVMGMDMICACAMQDCMNSMSLSPHRAGQAGSNGKDFELTMYIL